MRTKLLVLLFCWVGMVGIKSGNACGKDKDENAVVLPIYERNGRMYVEIEQTYLGREWMVLAQIDRGLGIRGKLLESKGIFRLEQGRDSMTLDVFAVFCPERVSDTTWMSNGLLKMSGLQTPVETWPVAEKKETGYLIDVTDGIKEKWYVGDGKWGRIQYGRSEIITVDTCRNGACFTIRHYLECSPEQQVVEMLPESGSVPVEVSVALCLLPDRGLRNRGEDPDGLFRTQVYVDYGVNPFRCVECTRCVCWDTYAGMPLNICVAEDIPEEYVELLYTAVEKLNAVWTARTGRVLLELERKKGRVKADVPCAVGFDVGGGGIKVDFQEHPGDGRILAARLRIGADVSMESVIRYRLENPVREEDGIWKMCSETEALQGCREQEIDRALAILLGLDPEQLENRNITAAKRLEALWYCYAEREDIKTEKEAAGQWGWKRYEERRVAWQQVLKEVENEKVKHYYREVLKLSEKDYIRWLDETFFQEGMAEQLMQLLKEDIMGFYAPSFLQKNKMGMERDDMLGRLQRVWGEFFRTERWLQLAEKENGEQQVGQLVKELKRLITGKRVGRLSVQERLVRQTCVMAFCEELKKYKDTVDCGEGMAKLLLWTYWEDLYDYWKIRSGGLARI